MSWLSNLLSAAESALTSVNTVAAPLETVAAELVPALTA